MQRANRHLTAIIVLVFGSMFANGQDATAANDNSFGVEIVADKSCYRLQDKINISITLKNEGAVPIFLYQKEGSDFLEGLKILLYDANGKLLGETNPRGVKTWLTPRPDDFLELSSGDRFRQDMAFTLASRGCDEGRRVFCEGFLSKSRFTPCDPEYDDWKKSLVTSG